MYVTPEKRKRKKSVVQQGFIASDQEQYLIALIGPKGEDSGKCESFGGNLNASLGAAGV